LLSVTTGTTDRVCLITGPAACVREAHDVIWEKLRSRVDTSKIGMEELQVTAAAIIKHSVGFNHYVWTFPMQESITD